VVVLGAALVAGMATSVVTLAAPAEASVTGVVRYEETSDLDSYNKAITVECPAGTNVLNAGGYITGGGGSVVMDDIFPNELLTTVTVNALETDPYGSDWTVTASAICGTAPAGLHWYYQASSWTSADKPVTAACPSNRRLLGVGATIEGGLGEVIMDQIRPNGSAGVAPTAVTVEAYEDVNISTTWRVLAYAICAYPVAGLQTLWDLSDTIDSDDKGAAAECPFGQVATGGGAEVGGAEGEIVIDDTYSNGSRFDAPDTFSVYGFEEDPTSANWDMVAWIICANL
jgi:hypothetical protein